MTYIFFGYPGLDFDIGPVEVSGAVLGLLLVLRTNAGYDRWWEARKLWGGIVNQCRNLVISALAYGPADLEWKRKLVAWVCALPHVVKKSLRGETQFSDLNHLLTPVDLEGLSRARHSPSFVVQKIAELIQSGRKNQSLDSFSFLQMDREKATLIDHIGACERILKTPIPWVIAIKVRRFISLFLLLVPFVLIDKVGWYTPIVMFIISYPLLSLDQIGIELQNPFKKENLSHLPLSDISKNIELDLNALLEFHL
jgi:putative membrane protein